MLPNGKSLFFYLGAEALPFIEREQIAERVRKFERPA